MKLSQMSWIVVVGLGLLVAGCSTPETRIKGNPMAFEQLTAEQQDLVREGRVGIGFGPEAVKLALGEPDRVWMRKDKSGESESWSYTVYETVNGAPLFRGNWHRYYCPSPLDYPYYAGYGARKEREVMKVVFEDGAVSSVESES